MLSRRLRPMKHIVAYIRPTKLEAVLAAIGTLGVREIIYGEVRGYGRQKEHLDSYHEPGLAFSFLPKTRIAIDAEDTQVEPVIEAITKASRTGRIGDGKILVVDAQTA